MQTDRIRSELLKVYKDLLMRIVKLGNNKTKQVLFYLPNPK